MLDAEAESAAKGGDLSEIILPPNPIHLMRLPNEPLLVGMTFPSAVAKRDPDSEHVLDFRDLYIHCRMVPGPAWTEDHGYAAIKTHDPAGERYDLYVMRGIAYTKMLRQELVGWEHAPGAGWTTRLGLPWKDERKRNLQRRNVGVESASEHGRHSRNSFKAAWTICHRLSLIGEGRNPHDLLPSAEAAG